LGLPIAWLEEAIISFKKQALVNYMFSCIKIDEFLQNNPYEELSGHVDSSTRKTHGLRINGGA
jgi:hypothetical protein